MMNPFIYEMFDTMIANSSYKDDADKKIQSEVSLLLKPYEQTRNRKEYEKLRDILFSVSITSV